MNQNFTNGTFYLGVSGGEGCLGPGGPCGVSAGTQIITYQLSMLDQRWGAEKETTAPPPVAVVQDYYNDYADASMCLAVANNSKSANTNLVIWECQTETQGPGQYWKITKAEDLGAPYTGCFAFMNQNSGMAMSVYQGVVKNGSRVIQWPLCTPTNGACGNPSNQWHPDQFWCPSNN